MGLIFERVIVMRGLFARLRIARRILGGRSGCLDGCRNRHIQEFRRGRFTGGVTVAVLVLGVLMRIVMNMFILMRMLMAVMVGIRLTVFGIVGMPAFGMLVVVMLVVVMPVVVMLLIVR